MSQPQGPGSPYQLLFSDVIGPEPSLPETFLHIYPGDWHIPPGKDRPYIYSNFAKSRDGRITYKEPGWLGGSDVTKFNPHDRWLMGLLRTRADAIMNGDVTLNLDPEHIWTAEYICPDDAPAFTKLRQAEGYKPIPLLVILSFDGHVDFEAACFKRDDMHIVLATTTPGAVRAKDLSCAATVDVHNLGDQAVDLVKLTQLLYSDYSIRHLLCEGGARVFANMLDAKLIDEEFVTLCPAFVGRSEEKFRPSYTEGVAWRPDTAPYSKPISLHRAGDFLFLRTQVRYQ